MSPRYKWYASKTNQDSAAGHYERKRSESDGWERCARVDVKMAIGAATAEELKRHEGPARSENGIFYRYIPHVDGEVSRKAG